MSTIDSKEIITTMLKNDGVYPGDPQAYTIWQYTNDYGNTTHAVYWTLYNDILSSPHCRDIVLLWDREGLTYAGKEFLRGEN
jgi:hypothetical protein